jgi:hypothetical protein
LSGFSSAVGGSSEVFLASCVFTLRRIQSHANPAMMAIPISDALEAIPAAALELGPLLLSDCDAALS